VEGDLADARHQERVAEAEHHGEREEEEQTGERLSKHGHEVT